VRQVPADQCDAARAAERRQLLTLVLYYVSSVVAKNKLWAQQGNTTDDGSECNDISMVQVDRWCSMATVPSPC
jgi:hypothetical protein